MSVHHILKMSVDIQTIHRIYRPVKPYKPHIMLSISLEEVLTRGGKTSSVFVSLKHSSVRCKIMFDWGLKEKRVS